MDFIRAAFKEDKEGYREYYPSLQAIESQDLVIRGGQFVAIWDEEAGLYCRQPSLVPTIIDNAFVRMVKDSMRPGDTIRKMRVFDNQSYSKFLALVRSIGDMGPELDQKIVFADETPTKADAASFKMPYSLSEAACPAWDELVSTLYSVEDRIKIEWAIGSIFTGAAANNIQKFYVFFGPPGSGKSTILSIIEKLFEGHTANFSAADVGRRDFDFALEPFQKNPLVAFDHDGDLSRIDTNQRLNSIVSHDNVMINSKGKSLFTIRPRATLFIGTNTPVKISDRKSGLFRRLIDIQPTGEKIDEDKYFRLLNEVQFELGSIARHCIEVFERHGHEFFSSYRSTNMMYRTNDIFNFVEDNRLVLKNGVTLKQVHKMFQQWCEDTDTKNIYKQFQFRDLLQDYFEEFHDQIMVNGQRHRSWFTGLKDVEQFAWKQDHKETHSWLELAEQNSLLDEILSDLPAQYSTGDESHPLKHKWEDVKTRLKDLDTRKEHYTKVPTQHIVIDFDLKDENGDKSLQRNLDAAALWPPTYAEVSRGGNGIHLHYRYSGDVARLANRGADGSFEIKTLLGNGSLRRRLSSCNNLPVAVISSGLPFKEEKVLSKQQMSSEKSLRDLIKRALRKEINFGTKSNMDFIKKVLDDADKQGLAYDVSDMWDEILAFAMNSTNQASTCMEIALGLKLKSDEEIVGEKEDEGPLVFYDLEIYPNLFAIGWMYDDEDAPVTKMVNPTAQEVQEFIEQRIRRIGYNNRKYDAHILWAASLGYTPEQLFLLSQRIIVDKDRNAMFGSAYSLDYADVFDYASEKKSLKMWMVEMGLPHMEMDLPWDQPVPEDRIEDVLKYLENDVRGTRAVHHHRGGDFRARQILADLTGKDVISTTNQLTERLVFGDLPYNEKPKLEYTDLRERFPGYEFDQFKPGKDKSTYKGEVVGEGGLVRSKPGMYENVALLDVASMHPTSIIELNLFGEYTANFKRLIDIRLALKKGDFDTAIDLDERLAKHLMDPHEGYNPKKAKEVSDALKIAINSVYGLTAASFPNKFRDDRNIDNIVAKRGALFMLDLREFVESQGFEVVHIKTDSIKIPNATPEIIEMVSAFGRDYGYTFEHEATYEKFCLVNDAVYVCRKDGKWSATGAQFQHPIVFKTLFSKEEFVAQDYVEVKQVSKGAMYLVSPESGARQFVGRFGAFVPVLGGRVLLRVDGEKEGAVTNTKGHLWEIDEVALAEEMEVDMSYFQRLVTEAAMAIEKYGSFQEFLS